MITKIKNAIFVTDTTESEKSLYINDGKITAFTKEELAFDREIDGNGMYVSPGFIDIHTHGAGGFDFADGGVDDILSAALAHARFGTTTVFPTCPSISFENMLNFVCNVKKAMELNTPGRPYIAGAHLEGPYFSMAQRGAQNPEYIKPPLRCEYEKLVAVGSVRRISYAPELEGSEELCRFLNDRNIVSAFAHTDGIYEEIKPLIDMGCKLATHLYSGMNTVTRRSAYRKLGAVEAALLCDAMRAIDYLETRSEIDITRLGATGTSGGGMMTSLLMAYDERISAASPSCFLTTRRAYYYSGSWQDAEQIWFGASSKHIDHFELVSSFCPKPLLLLAADSDFFPIEGSEILYKKEKGFYRLMGNESGINMFIDQSEHGYSINHAIRSAEFFTEIFYGEKVKVSAENVGLIPEVELQCTESGQIGVDLSDSVSIFEENLEFYNSLKPKSYEEKKKFFSKEVFEGREDYKFYLKSFKTEDEGELKAGRYMWYSTENMPCYGVSFKKRLLILKILPSSFVFLRTGQMILSTMSEK